MVLLSTFMCCGCTVPRAVVQAFVYTQHAQPPVPSHALCSSLSLANNQLSGALPAFWGSAGYWPALQELTLQVEHTRHPTIAIQPRLCQHVFHACTC